MTYKNAMKLALGIFSFVVIAGCAAPKIYVNGAPASSHLNILKNPETEMIAFFQATRHYEKKEGQEVAIWPEHVPIIGNKIKLKRDTRSLSLTVRIVNPKKKQYSLWEVYHIIYQDETYPYQVEHMLYSGSLSRKDFIVRCPTENAKSGAYRLEVRNRNGEPMFVIGNMIFEREESEVVPGNGK